MTDTLFIQSYLHSNLDIVQLQVSVRYVSKVADIKRTYRIAV